MRIEKAQLSLVGGREDNQDRAVLVTSAGAALLAVLDGMGGHSDGAAAASAGQQLLCEAFEKQAHPLFDPLGFLHLTLGRMHEVISRLGAALPLEKRPRATCAVCIVQGTSAYWAHVGDSRVYLIRDKGIVTRTRDHSHVEFLIREGSITEAQAIGHPLRNYVECCLGGEPMIPEMTVSGRHRVQSGDVLLVCSDGLWGTIEEERLSSAWSEPGESLQDALTGLARLAISSAGPNADNCTGVALRLLPPAE